MTDQTYADRITFDDELQIMEVDFTDFTFSSSAIVTAFYDTIEKKIEATGRKWYFLVKYRDCRIFPDAWMQYAARGKRLNLAYSLGTVRVDPAEGTRQEILNRARTENFNPNLVPSRVAAMERIAEMRAGR